MSKPNEDRISDEEDAAEAPLTMAASIVLTNLPKNTSEALDKVGEEIPEKVTVWFIPIKNAPALQSKKVKVQTDRRFSAIITHLRRKVGIKDHQSMFCYIGNVFSPSLDEEVGNLWSCFKVNDELQVHYAMTPAFG